LPLEEPLKEQERTLAAGKRTRLRISATALLKAARPVVKPYLAEPQIIIVDAPELNRNGALIPRISVGFPAVMWPFADRGDIGCDGAAVEPRFAAFSAYSQGVP
jgi:hypothetical protein